MWRRRASNSRSISSRKIQKRGSDITDVEIDGDKARAEVGGGGIDITSEYDLVFEDGTWKIDKASLS